MGLDYFLARYYSGAQGRFLSVDPENASASLFNPQSWNGYTYVLNNPNNYVDPNGEIPVFIATGLIGAGVGFAGNFGYSVATQWINDGWNNIEWGQAATAGIGGAVDGGLAGLTMGALGPAAGIKTALAVNGGTSVAGGAVTRFLDNLFGYENSTSVSSDFIGGTLGVIPGTKVADIRYPLRNIKKELKALQRKANNPKRRSIANRQIRAIEADAAMRAKYNEFMSSLVSNPVENMSSGLLSTSQMFDLIIRDHNRATCGSDTYCFGSVTVTITYGP